MGFVPLSVLFHAIAPAPNPKDGPPCHLCSALCCKYFAIEIDRPTTPRDHDEIRWFLMHENVVVWMQEGDWYVEVRNVCRNLRADNTCGIYETRPQICRDYGLPDVEGPCEYFSRDADYDLMFESVERFESWSKVELAKRERRLARRREQRRLRATEERRERTRPRRLRAGVRGLLLTALLLTVQRASAAEGAAAAYEAMRIPARDVLTGTVLTSQVTPGGAKQVVGLATYFTGKRDDAGAVNVRLEVLRTEGEHLAPIYSRDFGKENGGYVGRGDLQLVDLDGDGVNEIVVSYDSVRDRLIEERRGEVIVYEPAGFRTVWSGLLGYDATRAAREVPNDRRDRYTRELDISGTLRTRGLMLIFTKTVIAVAGERLPQPKVSQESFPLRSEARK